jgi:molybdopterin molybdotransferase
MLTYDEALAQILGGIAPLPPVVLPLAEALGCVLAEDVTAPFPLPPFANSSMDGFAVRAADLAQMPVTLPVQGDIPAGALSVPALDAGKVLRIMTGAPIPQGADAVVPVEETEAAGGGVRFRETVTAGQCVRPAGEDVVAGSVVLSAGELVRAAHVGMAASVGRASLWVRPRPRVAVLSTGDELVEPGATLQPGQIYNSNAYALAAAVAEAGGVVTHRIHARDTAPALRAALDAGAGADVLVSSGGVSVGDYDFVKDVFAERGTLDFWRAAIRPGKPVAFGRWGETLFFGLPGNPVSSLVTFELFARPALRRLAGRADAARTPVQATLTEDAAHAPGRQSYQRAVVTPDTVTGGYFVRPLSRQGSGMLSALVEANALLVLAPDAARFPAGASVPVFLLD